MECFDRLNVVCACVVIFVLLVLVCACPLPGCWLQPGRGGGGGRRVFAWCVLRVHVHQTRPDYWTVMDGGASSEVVCIYSYSQKFNKVEK